MKMAGTDWRAPRSRAEVVRRWRVGAAGLGVLIIVAVVVAVLWPSGSSEPETSPEQATASEAEKLVRAWAEADGLQTIGSISGGDSFSANGFADGRVYGTVVVESQPVAFYHVNGVTYIEGSDQTWAAWGINSKQGGWVRDDAGLIPNIGLVTPPGVRETFKGAGIAEGLTVTFPGEALIEYPPAGYNEPVTAEHNGMTFAVLATQPTPDSETKVADVQALLDKTPADRFAVVVKSRSGKLSVNVPR